jgi:hypothetical protein
MWNSVTLKRSLLQISKATKPSVVVCRSMSAVPYWETLGGGTETNHNSNSNNDPNSNNIGNGIIRFTMTPKAAQHHPSSTTREFGTSMDGAIAASAATTRMTMTMPNTTQSTNTTQQLQLQPQQQVVVDVCEDPFFDRTIAAEHMAKHMENSYYYASFKARGSSHEE